MTGRTHDVAAVAAVSLMAFRQPLPPLDAVTLAACAVATFTGGLAPDLDKPGSSLWRRLPGGGVLARVARPAFVGGHRNLSHSLPGGVLFALLARAALLALPEGYFRPVPVWTCFVVAYVSHLVMDTLTEAGVPWLFPFGGTIGFPPMRRWRIKSGGWFEHGVVLPILWGVILATWRAHLPEIIALLRSLGAGAH
ncbi:MAG: metal-dependent hydrolase [Armatimonadetes bacterium]|nr:metal-dependent hydrolase [Armatimonadota bacterium]